eukprot:1463462-Alexandrium_andersonii.AAC.1
MEGEPPAGKATVASTADAAMLRDLASGQGIELPYCILLSDAVATSQENDADGPLAEAGAQWRWIR